MLAETVHVQADLIGQLDLLDDLVQPVRSGDELPGGRISKRLGERANAKLHQRTPSLAE